MVLVTVILTAMKCVHIVMMPLFTAYGFSDHMIPHLAHTLALTITVISVRDHAVSGRTSAFMGKAVSSVHYTSESRGRVPVRKKLIAAWTLYFFGTILWVYGYFAHG